MFIRSYRTRVASSPLSLCCRKYLCRVYIGQTQYNPVTFPVSLRVNVYVIFLIKGIKSEGGASFCEYRSHERSAQADSHEISQTLSKMLLDAILCIVAFKRVVWVGHSLTRCWLLSRFALHITVLSVTIKRKETCLAVLSLPILASRQTTQAGPFGTAEHLVPPDGAHLRVVCERFHDD